MTLSYEDSEKINRLVARKKYPVAAKMVSDLLRDDPNDPQLRKQLGELLRLSGQPKEALKVMLGLVKQYTDEGYVTKALALLKKLERDYPDKAGAIHQCTVQLTRRYDREYHTDIDQMTAEPEMAPESPKPEAPEPDFKLKTGAFVTPTKSEKSETAQSKAQGPEVLDPAETHQFNLHGTEPTEPKRRRTDIDPKTVPRRRADDHELNPPLRRRKYESAEQRPVFDFPCSHEELFSLYQGLELKSYGPGEIVCSEGEAGGSLMIIAGGTLRVYVHNQHNVAREVRLLHAGAFFGEISLLSGKPRTATIVTVYDAELLILDKPVLAKISKKHPDLLPILKAHYLSRANSPEEQLARTQGEDI